MKKNFRFYDNRQKYLLFVTTTNEKNQIADAIRPHVNKIKPQKPGIKIFDAGMGCLLYTSPSPRDKRQSRMPSSA